MPIWDDLILKLYESTWDEARDLLRQVFEKTGAKVWIPSTVDPNTNNRLVEITGDKQQIALALQEIAAYLSQEAEKGGSGIMMNPLYYAEMIGWQKYSNFAYPGEIPGT